MHACGGARNRRQEGDVLIVSVLIAIVVNLALRSNAQGRIKVPYTGSLLSVLSGILYRASSVAGKRPVFATVSIKHRFTPRTPSNSREKT